MIEIVISLGLMGAITMGGMRFMSYMNTSSKRSRVSTETHNMKRNIKNYIEDVTSCSENLGSAFKNKSAANNFVSPYKKFLRFDKVLLEEGVKFASYKVIGVTYKLGSVQPLADNARYNSKASVKFDYVLGFCPKGNPTSCPDNKKITIKASIDIPVLLNKNGGGNTDRILCNTSSSSLIAEGAELGVDKTCTALGLNSDCRLLNPEGTGGCNMDTHQAKLVPDSSGKMKFECAACEIIAESSFMCEKTMFDSCGKSAGIRDCSCTLDGSTHAVNTKWVETTSDKNKILSLKNSAKFYADKKGYQIVGFSFLTGSVGFMATLVDVCPKRKATVDFECDPYGELKVSSVKNEEQKWRIANGSKCGYNKLGLAKTCCAY